MAEGGSDLTDHPDWPDNFQEQQDEVCALTAIFEDTNNLIILSSPTTVEDTDQYNIRLFVAVHVEEGGVEIQAWAPLDYDINNTQQATAAAVTTGNKPTFQRTESGRRWHSSFHVNHLLPLTLDVKLPRSYPSQSPPSFTLSSAWLDATQLKVLCQQLDTRWQESEGMPVLYTWFDWLQNETLQFLGLERCVMMIPLSLQEFQDQDTDCRAIPECHDLRESLMAILLYDQEQDLLRFTQDQHTCEICFEEKPGKEFCRLNECLHHFCLDCLTGYCEVQVADGAVNQLNCPAPKCKSTLPPGIIREVLGEETYMRWESLLLQRALDTMGDIVWCPRCNNAVIREAEEGLNLANCTTCFFSFCTRCNESWHQGSLCVGIEDKIKELEESSKKHSNESEKKRKLRQAWLLKMEHLSRDVVKKTSKPCPNKQCGIDISKTEGCNKVVCSHCGETMCFLCGKAIKGYDHFNTSSGCNGLLFADQLEGRFLFAHHLANRERPRRVEEIEIAMRANPEALNNICHCPRCRQRNLKENRNNHIRCWCCKSNFCFLCKQLIVGIVSNHFQSSSPCKQHSD